jgi:hypothetical protein
VLCDVSCCVSAISIGDEAAFPFSTNDNCILRRDLGVSCCAPARARGVLEPLTAFDGVGAATGSGFCESTSLEESSMVRIAFVLFPPVFTADVPFDLFPPVAVSLELLLAFFAFHSSSSGRPTYFAAICTSVRWV